MRTPSRLLFTTALASLTLLGAACSDDDDAAGGDSVAEPSDTGGGRPTGSTGGGADTEPAPDSPFCNAAAAFVEIGEDITLGTDVGETIDVFGELAGGLRELADNAPDEIADDADRLASASEDLVAGLEDAEPADRIELATAVSTVTADLEPQYPDLDAASERVAAFVDDECGIDFEGAIGGG